MTYSGISQILLFLGIILVLTKPMGIYLTHVYSGERTFLGSILGPIERFLYKTTGVDPTEEMSWKRYAATMIIFSLISVAVLYVLQRMQFYLPLNPQGFPAPSEHSSFNTAVSFTTNTNWQGYAGESTMSYLTQMAGLAVQNFASAAVGMASAGQKSRMPASTSRSLKNPPPAPTKPCMA